MKWPRILLQILRWRRALWIGHESLCYTVGITKWSQCEETFQWLMKWVKRERIRQFWIWVTMVKRTLWEEIKWIVIITLVTVMFCHCFFCNRSTEICKKNSFNDIEKVANRWYDNWSDNNLFPRSPYPFHLAEHLSGVVGIDHCQIRKKYKLKLVLWVFLSIYCCAKIVS